MVNPFVEKFGRQDNTPKRVAREDSGPRAPLNLWFLPETGRRMTADATSVSREAKEFSLVSGGFFNAFLTRLHLLREPVELLRERSLAFSALTWLPLLLLSLLEGNAYG